MSLSESNGSFYQKLVKDLSEKYLKVKKTYCINYDSKLLRQNLSLAQDINTKRSFAVKRESLDIEHPQLFHESKIYDILAGGRMLHDFYKLILSFNNFNYSLYSKMSLVWST